MQTKRRRAAPMAADQRRAEIIAAVLSLLEQYGGDVTTRQIAEAAGIAEGTIFRAFRDKRSLFLAAAEQAVAPPGWREDMAGSLEEIPVLHDKVVYTVERMVERTRSLLLVLTALRSAFFSEGPPKKKAQQLGPPAFLVDAGRDLHDALTELVFEPHAAELSVPPATAARAMRSLVMGAWHPGALDEDRLSTEEISELLLHGVTDQERRDS